VRLGRLEVEVLQRLPKNARVVVAHLEVERIRHCHTVVEQDLGQALGEHISGARAHAPRQNLLHSFLVP
jgi:hypothetical protein